MNNHNAQYNTTIATQLPAIPLQPPCFLSLRSAICFSCEVALVTAGGSAHEIVQRSLHSPLGTGCCVKGNFVQ